MIPKIEIEIKYNLSGTSEEAIESYFNQLISDLNLKNGYILSNNDIYYDNDDILEAYKITVRKRDVAGQEVYTLKKDITDSKEVIKKEIYEFASLDEVLKFLKTNCHLVIDSLQEKMPITTKRKKYIHTYKSAVIEILVDEFSFFNASKKEQMLECKFISGNLADFLEFNQTLSDYSFLHRIIEAKKELGEEYIEKPLTNPFNTPIDPAEYYQKLNIYFKGYADLLERLQRLNEQKENLRRLHSEYGPLEKPLVVTISGTPRSGKTTCINNLFEFFKKADFKTICLEEPAGLVYSTLKSKEQKAKLLEDRVGFVERQLAIGEENIEKNLTGNEILLCDRGALDTYIWYDMYYKLGMISKERYQAYLQGLKRKVEYLNEFYILYANSLASMYRDYQNSLSIEPRSTMNEANIKRYNSSLMRMVPTFASSIDYVEFIDTSDYAKMDASILVASDLAKKIENLYRSRRK